MSGEDDAAEAVRSYYAADWDYDVADVHVLGMATKDVCILRWNDLGA